MAEEFLQVAFEIKAVCDEISRRLLRWHWEQRPGNRSLDALLQHIDHRGQESPDYYDRLPDLSGKTSWSQLDTTVCMRVLLDPEKDAEKPLDLLGNTPRPGAARHACNAVRTARNEAAHAADHADTARAAILFSEAVEALEEGYVGTALRTDELEQYYRMADDFVSRCGGEAADESAGDAKQPTASRSRAHSTSARTKSSSAARQPAAAKGRTGSSDTRKSGSSGKKNAPSKAAARKTDPQKKSGGHAALWALLVVTALGLLARAFSMGLFSR